MCVRKRVKTQMWESEELKKKERCKEIYLSTFLCKRERETVRIKERSMWKKVRLKIRVCKKRDLVKADMW